MNGFRVGDKVVASVVKGSHLFYPICGTEGEVKWIDPIGIEDNVLVQWPLGSTVGDGKWWCSSEHLIKKQDAEKYQAEKNEALDDYFEEWGEANGAGANQ